MTALDQLFINLNRWAVGLFPAPWQPLVSALVIIAFIIGIFALLFGVVTVIERKAIGRMQNRFGPNRVGIPFTQVRLFGFGQFVADGLKALTKEDVVPRAADRLVHFLAPVVLILPVLLSYSVLPFGRNMAPIDIDGGLFFFFAVGAATELAVFMAGWSSRNKYSLLGAMRAVAQMISYEIPLILSAIAVVMIAGTLSLPRIAAMQEGGFWHWHVLTPWGLAGLVIFFIASLAEANRSPFDLPEAESELVAGYFTEYSGFKFALFFMAEYLGMFAMSGLGVTLFLGGWTAPLPVLNFIPSWAWFMAKLCALILLFIWLRGTLPRLRVDQLMNFAWKFMLPLTLINLVNAAVWHYTGGRFWGWLIGVGLVLVSYLALGRTLFTGRNLTRREYRYADSVGTSAT
jgi:NADH-quinone oxidoreductase subunit H